MWQKIFTNRWQTIAWVTYIFSGNLITALSVIQEYARLNIIVEPWEVITWEFSSGIMVLALIPLLITFDQYFPINIEQRITGIVRQFAMHFPAVILFSLIHVGGFIAIRKWVYSLADRYYSFGDVPIELLYEFRKDFASYFTLLAILYAYRELRRLKGGEAKLKQSVDQDESSLKLVATKGAAKVIIEPKDIDSIESAGNYVQLHVAANSYLMRATMQNVADQLKPFNFSRVHRAHIVNESKIVAATPKNGGGLSIKLSSGANIECSRRYRQNLKAF